MLDNSIYYVPGDDEWTIIICFLHCILNNNCNKLIMYLRNYFLKKFSIAILLHFVPGFGYMSG